MPARSSKKPTNPRLTSRPDPAAAVRRRGVRRDNWSRISAGGGTEASEVVAVQTKVDTSGSRHLQGRTVEPLSRVAASAGPATVRPDDARKLLAALDFDMGADGADGRAPRIFWRRVPQGGGNVDDPCPRSTLALEADLDADLA
jgi:hypothetical protein